jgi:hypothetical protein
MGLTSPATTDLRPPDATAPQPSVGAHPAFVEARAELDALGFTLSPRPLPGSRPYAIIGGRSNARWWLVPLESGRLTASGLALFQPIVPSARLLKAAALAASGLGLSRLWVREVVHVSGGAVLADVFRDAALRYAFFTGTDGPHRKAAVQIMDAGGAIRGFAKASASPVVRPLLSHEASVLRRLEALELRSALVPTLLFSGEAGGATVLVTDTRKTASTRTATKPGPLHAAFVREVREKTVRAESPGWLGRTLRERCGALGERLPLEWRQRLSAATSIIEERTAGLATRSLSHGDFTASNTFLVAGALYVFDWEYASEDCAPGHDLLHFVLSSPATLRMAPEAALGRGRAMLRSLLPDERTDPGALVLAYLAGHALHYASRERGDALVTWAGEPAVARLLDAALASRP